MDISAALTPGEIAALSDPDCTCEQATRQLRDAGAQQDGGTFEESLRLKNTLDIYEEKGRSEPSWEHLSVLVNCEYNLYVLNEKTPLRNNPFLSHWVEAIQRLERTVVQREESDGRVSSSGIDTVRVELIKALLQSRNPSQFARLSPRKLYESFVALGQTTLFDISTYIRMLEEEGIYEKTPEPPESQDPPKNKDKQAVWTKEAVAVAGRPKLNNFQQWKQSVLSRLQTEPTTTIPEFTHLPIELSYLDFLTTLLQERTLQSFSIDPAPVIADYIQHALRLTEQMGQPPGTSSDAGGSNGDAGAEEDIEIGREAQTRAVKLLLLFMRNLIRKALLPPEAIYFEIQEVCVRYVWIKEVRDFRAFVEEGAVEQAIG